MSERNTNNTQWILQPARKPEGETPKRDTIEVAKLFKSMESSEEDREKTPEVTPEVKAEAVREEAQAAKREAIQAAKLEAIQAAQKEEKREEAPAPVVEAPAPAVEIPVPVVEAPAPTKTAELETAKAPKPAERKVIFGVKPTMPYSIEEAINRLRINISFLGGDVKKIMIVSSEPNEGKSFLAMNLWKQMAMAGEKSILIDLDMRKSTMASKYQLKRSDGVELKGTSHFLSGEEPIEEMILHTEMEFGDILPNVDNIVNPSMLFESRKFTEMMKYAEENYRYVFLDVPPLGLVSDGELIGSVCDGAVLCVRAGSTSRNVVRHSLRQLERAGCPLLGIVLNRVGGAGSGYYHKYYGKKYYNDKYYTK